MTKLIVIALALLISGCSGLNCPFERPDCCDNLVFGCGPFDLPDGCDCGDYL
jgi:hypothetical protein